MDGLVDQLEHRRMLVVLDNCEHLVDACAALVDLLTRNCPDLRLLATSRQRLGIQPERTMRIAPIDWMIQEPPEELRLATSGIKTIRARINAVDDLVRAATATDDLLLELRLQLLAARIDMLRDVVAQDKIAGKAITRLVSASGTSLCDIVGIGPRAAAELAMIVGDVDRFTQAGFARYNGTAPLPASSGEGRGAPVRHRLSRSGNRQLNAVIHRVAMTQLRFEPRARTLYDNARERGHTKREAMRVLKRHLSNVIFRTMRCDARTAVGLT